MAEGRSWWGVIPGGASQVATRSLAVLELRSHLTVLKLRSSGPSHSDRTSFLAVLKLLPFGPSHLTFK